MPTKKKIYEDGNASIGEVFPQQFSFYLWVFKFYMIAVIKNTGIWIDAYHETRTLKMGTQVKWRKSKPAN